MIKKNIIFNFKFSLLFWLILFSFFTRLLSAYILGDQNIWDEWGILVDNLINFQSYSFYKFNDQLIPSVYMPPMYPFFLYLTKIITFQKFDFLNLIIFFQVILSTFSVYIFYQINTKIFSNKLSLINSFIFSFFPLNLYVTGQISSICLQIFLSLLFLKYFLFFCDNQSKKNIIILSIVSAALILTRGEFILIFAASLLYLFIFRKIRFNSIIRFFLIIVILVSPYLIRNYYTFDEIIIVKSSGFNLWKGNNQIASVGGTPSIHPPNTFEEEQWKSLEGEEFKSLKDKLDSIKIDKMYEINRDNIFLEEAKNNIINNPQRYLGLFFKKMFSFYFVDTQSTYPNYYNFLHFFPVLALSIISFPGILLAARKNNFKTNYLLLYLALNLVIFSIFFILPRYKLIILPIQIILTAYFVQYVLNRLNIKNL